MQEKRTVPYGYCQCGCGEKTSVAPQTISALGVVKGEPRRYINGHQRRKSPVEYIEEDRGYTTPCWVWQRAINSHGYGRMPSGSAHRGMYERHKGPIPDGLTLDHLCRVRACVNPDHLEPVTNAENLRRGHHTHKLTMDQAAEIRASDEGPSALAEKYGVTRRVIWLIRTGQTYKQ